MSAPLQILHVFSTFGLGGPQVRTAGLVNCLGTEFEHTIVAVDGHYQAAALIHPGAAYRTLEPPPGRGGPFYSLEWRRLLERTRPDLLVTYNWGAFDAVVAGTLSRICPVLHCEDGFGSDEAGGLKRRRVWTRRLFVKRTRAVVVPSRTLRDIAVEQYKMPPDRVRWIVNGVDVRRFRPARNTALREAWGASPDTVLFGYCGRLGHEKNVGLLLRAFAAADVPNARLALIGGGPARAELESLTRDLGLAGRVVFAGRMADTAPCYQAMDVFAMSSVTEQMPVSLLEAMACGVPALCTDVGDCAEMLGEAAGPAAVPSGDLAGYTEAIRKLGRSRALREKLGGANRERAVSRYSFDQMLAAYAGLYRFAAAAGGRRFALAPAGAVGN